MRGLWLAFVGAVVASACGEDAATSVVLAVQNGSGAPMPDAVLARAYGPSGLVHDTRRFVVTATGSSLGTLVVHRRGDALDLRIQAVGMVGDGAVSEGVLRVTLRPDEQLTADLVLKNGRLPDADFDTVPDEIDLCPAQADPAQDQPSCAPAMDAAALAADVAPDGKTN